MVAVAVLVGALAWRLTQGPVSLAIVKPLVERAIAARGAAVEIGALDARWVASDRELQLVARDIAVAGQGGERARVEAAFAPEAIWRGGLRLSSVKVQGGLFGLTLSPQGQISLRAGAPVASALRPPDPQRAAALRESLARLIDQRQLAGFRGMNVSGSTLVVLDQATGLTWRAEALDIGLAQDGRQRALRVRARIVAAERVGSLDLALAGAATMETAGLGARMDGLWPALLLPRDIAGGLALLDAPLSGRAVGQIRASRLQRVELDAALGAGRVLLAQGARPIQSGALSARHDAARDTLMIERARLTAPGGGLDASGVIAAPLRLLQGGAAGLDLRARTIDLGLLGVAGMTGVVREARLLGSFDRDTRVLTIRELGAGLGGARARLAGEVGLPAADAARFHPRIVLTGAVDGAFDKATLLSVWPTRLVPPARRWVETDFLSGVIIGGEARLDIEPDDFGPDGLDAEDLSLSWQVRDAAIRHAPGLTPITQAQGAATLTGKSLTISAPQGRIGAIRLSEGAVTIPRFQRRGTIVQVSARAVGDAAAMARLLDMGDLRLFSKAGVAPQRLSGAADVRIRIERPTAEVAGPDALRWSVSGGIERAGLADAFLGEDLTGASLRLEGDNAQIRVEGPGDLGATRLDLVWREALSGGGKTPTLILASGVADAAALELFGIDASGLLTGAIDVDVRAVGQGGRIAGAVVTADLADAAIRAPGGGWSKPPGAPGQASFRVFPTAEAGWRIAEFRGDGAGLSVAGEVTLDKEGGLVSADFPRVEFQGLAAFSARAFPEDDGSRVEVRGPFLNLQGAGPRLFASDPLGGEASQRPLSLEATFETVRLGPDAAFSDVSITARLQDGQVARANAAGRSPAGVSRITISPAAGGRRRLDASAADAGLAARLFYPAATVKGGVATLIGEMAPPGARQPTRLELRASNFSVQTPARTAGGAAQTYAFDQLYAPLTLRAGRVEVADSRASGPSLGVTASGRIDLDAGMVDLQGSIVPAYALNAAFGDIPLLGGALVSRQGEGLLALTYTLRGPLDKPRVQTNPLSALAPGFLRRLFEAPAPRAPPSDVAAPATGAP